MLLTLSMKLLSHKYSSITEKYVTCTPTMKGQVVKVIGKPRQPAPANESSEQLASCSQLGTYASCTKVTQSSPDARWSALSMTQHDLA
jgi:hypothetical protein